MVDATGWLTNGHFKPLPLTSTFCYLSVWHMALNIYPMVISLGNTDFLKHWVTITIATLTEHLLYAKHCLDVHVLPPQPSEICTFIISVLQTKTAKHTGSNLPKVIPIGSSGAMVLIQSQNHTACCQGSWGQRSKDSHARTRESSG